MLEPLSQLSVFGAAAMAAAAVIFIIVKLGERGPDQETRKLEQELERLRAPWPLAKVRSVSMLGGVGGGTVFFLLTENAVFTAVIVLIGFIIPAVYPGRIRKNYMNRFEEDFSECLEIWARCLTSGLSFQQAVETASNDLSGPVANEMETLHSEVAVGGVEEALWHLHDRVPVQDVRYAVLGVITCRQTGGRISEVMGNIAEAIRERAAQRERIRAITSMGRTEAYIMAVMPFALGLIMYILDPKTVGMLFSHWIGIVGTLAAIMWEAIGLVVIWKMVNIEA